jgi:hypothetical protein
MNGPQHYREAERIAAILLTGKDKGRRLTADDVARYAAAGELHARLAEVATPAPAGPGWLQALLNGGEAT